MTRPQAVGSKPVSSTPLFSEKTQKYVTRGVIVLLALAALGGAIYGGINLGTHNFTHLSEVGMWAVTGASSFVILCLAIGAIIAYKRTKHPQPKVEGASHPKTTSSDTSATSGSKGAAKVGATTPPIRPTPRIHVSNNTEFTLLSKLLGDKEYLREETTCTLGPTFRFQRWSLTNMPGSTSSSGYPPPGLESNKLVGKNSNDQIEDHIRSLGYRKVDQQTLLARAQSSSNLSHLSAVDKMMLTLLNDEPLIAKTDRIIPHLCLPQDRFSVLVSRLDHATQFVILKNDARGEINVSLCIHNVYSYVERDDAERLEAHFKELETSGLTFMTQRELFQTYRSERV